MPRLKSSNWKTAFNLWYDRYDTWQYEMDHKPWFCNHKATYPTYSPSIFSSFWFGCTWTSIPNFSFFSSCCTPIYFYTYFNQGLRLSCWAPLLLYLSTNLPRLSCLDRCSFSIFYNMKLKPREAKIKLFGRPIIESWSKWITHQNWNKAVAFRLAHFHGYFSGHL